MKIKLSKKSPFTPPPVVKTHRGFTLAEVLITLVVIGIIAAITVPTIMANHKRVEYASKIKKFYSTMNNALRLAETEQGISAYEWDFTDGAKNSFNKYFSQYITCVSDEDVKEVEYNESSYGFVLSTSALSGINTTSSCFLNDGTFFAYYVNSNTKDYTTNSMTFIFDLNGLKQPNSAGKDQFYFQIGASGPTGETLETNKCSGFSPMSLDECMGTKNITREQALRYCKSQPYSCSHLLSLDGWEFKDDYPIRL